MRFLACAAVALSVLSSAAEAGSPVTWSTNRARFYNWHANYAHQQYGVPVALVVPPTANLQTTYNWGVSSSALHRMDHQFGRNYTGPGPFGGPHQPEPRWPQSTTQFGVYHVRGVW